MTNERPARVGTYRLLLDFVGRGASVRILKLTANADAVESHLHHRSTQIYVALEGDSIIECDGVTTTLTPYEAFEVAKERLHSARAVTGSAVVMNISVPPVAADDQIPATAPVAQPESLRLPGQDSDIDD